MEYRKVLLGAVSVIALTAGAQQSARASVPPVDQSITPIPADQIGRQTSADPLFELVRRTNGSLTSESIETALSEMFANPTPADIQGFPTLLASIASMGAGPDVAMRSKDVLISIASDAPYIDAGLKDSVMTKLQTGEKPIMLAENKKLRPGLTIRPHKPAAQHEPSPPVIGYTPGH
jgi:hypothetical protein